MGGVKNLTCHYNIYSCWKWSFLFWGSPERKKVPTFLLVSPIDFFHSTFFFWTRFLFFLQTRIRRFLIIFGPQNRSILTPFWPRLNDHQNFWPLFEPFVRGFFIKWASKMSLFFDFWPIQLFSTFLHQKKSFFDHQKSPFFHQIFQLFFIQKMCHKKIIFFAFLKFFFTHKIFFYDHKIFFYNFKIFFVDVKIFFTTLKNFFC